MATAFDCEVEIDISALEARFSAKAIADAQALLVSDIAEDMNVYCMRDSGYLQEHMQTATDAREALIIWDAPYAKYAYNADTAKTDKNPNAHTHWAEFAKHQHLEEWKQDALRLLEERP